MTWQAQRREAWGKRRTGDYGVMPVLVSVLSNSLVRSEGETSVG